MLASCLMLISCHVDLFGGLVPGVDAPQNVVLVSIASALDPSMAPEGKHVIHAYTPGSEPSDIWEGMDRLSPEYKVFAR